MHHFCIIFAPFTYKMHQFFAPFVYKTLTCVQTSVMFGVLTSLSGLSLTWQQIELFACFMISVSLNPHLEQTKTVCVRSQLFPLCSSRACLGKYIRVFSWYKLALQQKETVFPYQCRWVRTWRVSIRIYINIRYILMLFSSLYYN